MLFSGNKLDNHAVVAIIGSFVIEFALLYGLAYLGYRLYKGIKARKAAKASEHSEQEEVHE